MFSVPQVNLGGSVNCKISCWSAMQRAKYENDWANALLRGVYGGEARFYRVVPRQAGNRKFPQDFLDISKGKVSSKSSLFPFTTAAHTGVSKFFFFSA